MIAHCPTQHRVSGFKRVEDRSLCDRTIDVELHFAVNARERTQMGRENYANHISNPKFETRNKSERGQEITKHECRMTKEARNANDKEAAPQFLNILSFVILSSFVIRISSFVCCLGFGFGISF
jgi:hypothetical protein